MANLKELLCKSMQKIFHVLGLENIPFNLWQEMKISYPWSQSLPTRLLRSVMKKKLLRGSEQSHKVYTRWGSNMVENVSATCYDLQSNLSRILGIGKVESAPRVFVQICFECVFAFFGNNIIQYDFFCDRNMRANTAQNPGNRAQNPQKTQISALRQP